ncbi:MAG: transcriptional repressor NrdR [Parcubacteria group bacterium Greene1014_47]|nr:MAG: transcriptional repressor NrdR [Parcubacteria group bacterium Greene1014_47]
MNCPMCQSSSKVINSRSADHGKTVKRRRVCMKCARRFTTYERIELVNVTVLKRSGAKEPYMRHKLQLGMRKALEKRPYTEQQFERLVSGAENDIFNREHDVISSEQIGQIVLAHLKVFDKVAYLRFASVYRRFGSTKAFEKEIEKLEKGK